MASATLTLVQAHLIGQFSQRMELGLILDYGYQLLRLPLSYFDSHRSGEVVSRIADARTMEERIFFVLVIGAQYGSVKPKSLVN